MFSCFLQLIAHLDHFFILKFLQIYHFNSSYSSMRKTERLYKSRSGKKDNRREENRRDTRVCVVQKLLIKHSISSGSS